MADAYCFGHVSTGRILRLRDGFPAADGYGEVLASLENHAGEATGTALVLARLGHSVVLEGNWIGDTPECRRTLAFLESRGIDCSGLVVKPGYPGATEIVISDGHTRTVFGRYCDLLFTTPQWEPPSAARLAASRIAAVDPAFGETTLAVVRAARAAGIPLVSCDARHDSPLAAACSALVISREMLLREYPAAAADEGERLRLFDRYLAACPGLVVFTSGTQPVWYGRGGDRAGAGRREMEPFRVEVVDSAGAGDSFRGGLMHGMLQGWPDEEGVRFACAVAALVCTTAPGCVHPPTLDEVTAFLRARQPGSAAAILPSEAAPDRRDGPPLPDPGQPVVTDPGAQLRQALRMEAFGQLAGGVAHAFNNILTVVLNAAGAAARPELSPEERLEAIGEIRDAAQRASSLTRQLLVFSRQHEMDPDVLDLNRLVSDLARTLGRVVGPDIDVQVELTPAPAMVFADAAMLEQVLVALAANARDAMPAGGELRLRVTVVTLGAGTTADRPSAPGAYVRLDVGDTGSGIAPENLSRVFEPFFTTKEVGKGAGLGLAAALGIVEQHDGWIDVASAPGQGTRFSIFLPRRDPTARAVASSGDARLPGGSETILFVEDDAPLRRAAVHALRRVGYRVVEAGSGTEALIAWRRHRQEIRLLVTDVLMPGGVSGRALAERLVFEAPALKVGFISGYDPYTLEAAAAGRARAAAVLSKPFALAALLAFVRQRLDA